MKKIYFFIIFIIFQFTLLSNGSDFWGINSQNLSNGGTQTSGVNDYTAAYYNPAKLPFIGLSNGGGYQFNYYALNIDLVDNRTEGNKKLFRIKSPKKLQTSYSSYTLGFTLPVFDNKNYGFNIGFVNNYIENDIAKISVFDEKIYQYYRYHSMVKTLLMNLGIGFKFLKNFGIGFGVAQLVSVVGQTDVQFKIGYDDDDDPYNDSFISGKDLYLGVVNQRAYNLSFFYKNSLYSLGLTLKQDLSLPYEIPASIVLKDFNGDGEDATIKLLIKGKGVWLPDEINFGASLNLKKQISSEFHLNISYQFWSKAPKPYSFTTINSDAELLKIEDLTSNQGEITYKDTINLNLAYNYYLDYNKLGFAISYRPSMIKNHDNLTNLIDNDIIAFSTGFKLKLLSKKGKNLYINFAYSLQHAISKSEYSSYYRSDVDYGGNIHLFYTDILYE